MINIRNILVLLLLFVFQNLYSNNLNISVVSINEVNSALKNCKVEFDISWENSWKSLTGASNWDAAWVFVKYRVSRNGEWKHATLSSSSSDHVTVLGAQIDAVSDGKGVFIRRSSAGAGNNYFNGIKLLWNFGQDSIMGFDSVQVKVIGIEMVYVPQGIFYAGDNNATAASFKQGSNDNDPWYIGSENAIYVTNGTGSGTGIGQTNNEFYYNAYNGLNGEDPLGATFMIPNAFPKGYASFYCMKYEISLGQYTSFLNSLTRQQQRLRVLSDISTSDIMNYFVMTGTTYESGGNTIICPQSNNGTALPIKFSTSTPERACNYLSWSDLVALLDWACLRPMTELEYEKSCRGTNLPVSREFAWGNLEIFATAYTVINDGAENEKVSNLGFATGNAIYYTTRGGIYRPFRCGVFSGSSLNNSRRETGATYYGIMEMAGNVKEQIITVGNAGGRSYLGNNGDGFLDEFGDANSISWPGQTNIGTGLKGGGLNSQSGELCVSERKSAAQNAVGFSVDVGGRGVRTTP